MSGRPRVDRVAPHRWLGDAGLLLPLHCVARVAAAGGLLVVHPPEAQLSRQERRDPGTPRPPAHGLLPGGGPHPRACREPLHWLAGWVPHTLWHIPPLSSKCTWRKGPLKHCCASGGLSGSGYAESEACTVLQCCPLSCEGITSLSTQRVGREEWSWRVVAGQNAAYDHFPCQYQIFYRGKARQAMWYDPVFQVSQTTAHPDAKFCG